VDAAPAEPDSASLTSDSEETAVLLAGIDHVAITVADMDATCAFYDRLFGARVLDDHRLDGRAIVRVIIVGGGVRISVHQQGNGVDLVARLPTPGSEDICFRFGGAIEEAVALLRDRGVEIVDGPSPRRTADRTPSQSVYFRDPDGNLVELMAAEGGWG
jgi:catechol 2,3-dioxygenase-like lactoylglutathione lyase family enzyme